MTEYRKLLIRCMEKWIDAEGSCWNGDFDATLTDEEKRCVNNIYEQLMYEQDERIKHNQTLDEFDEEYDRNICDKPTEGN